MNRELMINRLLQIAQEEAVLKKKKQELRSLLQEGMKDEGIQSLKSKTYTVSISEPTTKWVLRNQAGIIEGILADGDPNEMLMEKTVAGRMTVRAARRKKEE